MSAPSVVDILKARQRLRAHLAPTPLVESAWLSSIAGASVVLKVESLQLGRSFKIRGALNAALALAESGTAARQLVTASAGNHGRALAIAAERVGLPLVVFMPEGAPETKKAAIARHGAELRTTSDYDASEREARTFAQDRGATYISPYNHPDVIAGAGTIALELLEAMPALDVLVVPVGGGGLLSGLAIAMAQIAPGVSIVGVEAAASTPFATGIANGAMMTISVHPSLADGLVGNLEPGAMTFDIVSRLTPRLVAVTEDEIAAAIRGLAAEDHLIAEGAGAAATAAVIARKAVEPGQRAIVMMTGGNIDLRRFAEITRSREQTGG